jgi:hypothetical protein
MKKSLLIVSIIMIVIQVSCVNDKYIPEVVNNRCDTTYYSRIIKPIIVTNCTMSGCHNGQSSISNFLNYSEVKTEVEEIEDGESEFLHRIKIPLNHPGHMPVGDILSPSDVHLIEDWINDGYEGC